MLPNTLPLYSGEWDTQAGNYPSVGNAVRVSDDNQRGEFRLVLGEGNKYDVVVQHSVQNGKGVGQVAIDRHTLRISSTKVNEASGVEDVAAASFTITAPRRGHSNAELQALFNGLLGVLFDPAANADPVGFHSTNYAANVFQSLLSGAI